MGRFCYHQGYPIFHMFKGQKMQYWPWKFFFNRGLRRCMNDPMVDNLASKVGVRQ